MSDALFYGKHAKEMNASLIENPWGAPVYWLANCASTMSEARICEAEGAAHGAVVGADFQSEGRGRIAGRHWAGDAAQNLTFTLLLRFESQAGIPAALTLRIGLAAACALAEAVPELFERIAVKWPNDIMVGAKKICGILSENSGNTVFTGIGMNVFQHDFTGMPHATSILHETGSLPDRLELRPRLLNLILRRVYHEINSHDWAERLNKMLYMRGKRVTFHQGAADKNAPVSGILHGISPEGALLILEDGKTGPGTYITGEFRAFETPAPL